MFAFFFLKKLMFLEKNNSKVICFWFSHLFRNNSIPKTIHASQNSFLKISVIVACDLIIIYYPQVHT